MAEHQRLVKGTTNASTLMEKITRTRIYNSVYWNEKCFGLTEETLVDRAVELTHVGGTFGGNRKPTPFLCLVLKMLQMKPGASIVLEFIHNEDHKYARALGMFYWRLTARPAEVYRELEPLLSDYRKLRVRVVGGWQLSNVDSFVEELLTDSHCCDIALPSIPPRYTLERAGILVGPRKSILQAEFEQLRSAGANPGAPSLPVNNVLSSNEGLASTGHDRTAVTSRKRGPVASSSSSPNSSSSAGAPLAKRARSEPSEDLGQIIEITANDRLGKKVRVKCHEHALIIDVKKLCAAQLGTRPEKIRFQKWHSIMKDHIRLSDYEIREGANIELYYQ